MSNLLIVELLFLRETSFCNYLFLREGWKRHPRSAAERYSVQPDNAVACGGGDTPKMSVS